MSRAIGAAGRVLKGPRVGAPGTPLALAAHASAKMCR